MNLQALFFGLMAGYAGVVPTGPAGVTLLEIALRQGWTRGAISGIGIAIVDASYAGIAIAVGDQAKIALEPHQALISLFGGLVIASVGAAGLRRHELEADVAAPRGTTLRAFGKVALLTAINPLTILFFLGFIISAPRGTFAYTGSSLQFVLGVFTACVTWGGMLALIGSYSGQKAGARLKRRMSLFGNGLVIAIGLTLTIYGVALTLGLAEPAGLGS